MPIVGDAGPQVEAFFGYARERYKIKLARDAGKPAPWTKDTVLQKYPFCHVFREDDKTTVWFRKHVRNPLRTRPEVLLATVLFRLFARISVGETMFCQQVIDGKLRGPYVFNTNAPTAFDLYLEDGKVAHLRRAIRANCGDGPYVTGAYIIAGPPGKGKLDGMLSVFHDFAKRRCRCGKPAWSCAARDAIVANETSNGTLERMFNWLREHPYFGNFHSYEMVTDLRYTALLDRATDIDSWCSPGPGARRGLNRVMGRDKSDPMETERILHQMRKVLNLAWANRFLWPRQWPRWDMRTVEHTLCEFDKYVRASEPGGAAKMKRRFRSGGA